MTDGIGSKVFAIWRTKSKSNSWFSLSAGRSNFNSKTLMRAEHAWPCDDFKYEWHIFISYLFSSFSSFERFYATNCYITWPARHEMVKGVIFKIYAVQIYIANSQIFDTKSISSASSCRFVTGTGWFLREYRLMETPYILQAGDVRLHPLLYRRRRCLSVPAVHRGTAYFFFPVFLSAHYVHCTWCALL